MQNVKVFRRESFTTQLMFTGRPDKATRQQLKAAGFKFNGVNWWKNHNSLEPLKSKQLAEFLAFHQPEPANDNAELVTA